ncbi:MAG: hypothetical protein FWG10_09205 [Eubacteriaceae bacterium]|nr:hypothetical protein [Eubacteriaceae bacterium]
MTNSLDLIEILGIDITSITKNLSLEARLEGVSVGNFSEEKVKEAFRACIEAEMEEVQNVNSERNGTRLLIVRNKDGSDISIRVRNVWLNKKALLDALLDIAEFVLYLSPVSIIRAIKDIFKMLQIPLTSDEVFIFWTIYRASRKEHVSDDNYIDLIQKASVTESYDDLHEKKIKKIVEHLVEIFMLKKQDGNYVITEKMVVQWL